MAGRYLHIPTHTLWGVSKDEWKKSTTLQYRVYLQVGIEKMSAYKIRLYQLYDSYGEVNKEHGDVISAIDRAVTYAEVRLKELS